MKKILITTIVLICIIQVKSQIIDSTASYVRRDMYQKEAVGYPEIREADVLWKRTIWRTIDLREKINQVLYFPVEKVGNRISLIQLIVDALEQKRIKAYSAPVGNGYEFQETIEFDKIKELLGAKTSTIEVTDPVTGDTKEEIVVQDMKLEMIRQYQLKEEWVFDKSMSELRIRILGLCPVIEAFKDQNAEQIEANVDRSKTFWLYFPELREVLCNREIVNKFNEAESLTFDQFFFLRKFNSYIIKTGEREKFINEYTSGRESQLESKRIEEELFNFEHDVWSW